MKKYILLSVFSLLLSCSSNQAQIEQAKQDILNPPFETGTSVPDSLSSDSGSVILESTQVTPLDTKNFLSIEQSDLKKISPEEFEIVGTVLDSGVERITVDFQNKESDFPQDAYTLKTYTPGNTNFRYIASANFKVLDYGENIYTFSAYKGEEVSRTRIRIYIDGSSETSSGETLKNTTDIFSNLTSDPVLGDPIKLGETSFTYSQVKGFLVQKEDVALLDCKNSDVITQYLVQKYGYAYWNTCRDIVAGKSSSVNLLRLDGEKYMYERYFIDSYNGLTATYLLETGTGSKETLDLKNTELKSKLFPESEKFVQFFKNIDQ